MIDPFLRSTLPSMDFLRQSHREASSVMPHFSEMFEYLFSPGSFRAVRGFSLPSRYSMGSCDAVEARSLAKPAPLNTVDLDPEVKTTIRISASYQY